MADSTNTETDSLRADLDQLRKDFATLSKDVKDSSRGQVQAGADKVREGAAGLGSEIESHPVTSIVTAFGVGLLLGKVWSK